MPVGVECVEVSQRFGAQTMLDGVNWTLPPGAAAGLVGASGAGKTSLLRIIAGLDRCWSGQVTFSPAGAHGEDGARGGAAPARVGTVFQNLALWPHLTARRHGEGLLTGLPRRARQAAVEALLEEVRLPRSAWDRRPAELSGGEAQRLALARALAHRPDVLLLDEPLAQLDLALRGELLALIHELAHARRTTVVYVTHSWPEVMELCDRAAVLAQGRIVQAGPWDEVYRRPVSPAVARLTGPVCEIPCCYIEAGVVTIDAGWAPLREEPSPAPPAADESPPAASADRRADGARLVVRPQQVRLAAPGDRNRWRVVERRPWGAAWRLTLECDGRRLRLDAPHDLPSGRIASVHLRPHLGEPLHDAPPSAPGRRELRRTS